MLDVPSKVTPLIVLPVCSAVAVPALPEIEPVALPMFGVVKIGEVASTTFPDPVVAVTDKAPVPPEVVTIPFEVKFESVEIFCEVLTVIVFTERVSPVENVSGTS
jgi:hypothetical protein